LFHRFQFTVIKLAVFFIAPAIAIPSAISLSIGGNTSCEFGDCSNVDSLAAGQSTSGTIHFSFSVNGDPFSFYAPFSAANYDPHGTSVGYSPTVTYLGSSPSSQDDKFEIDFWQNYTYSGALNGKSFGESTGAIILNTGPGSNFTAQAFYGGQGLGVMGPFTEGDSSGSNRVTLSGLSGDPLTFEYQLIYDFNCRVQSVFGYGSSGERRNSRTNPARFAGSRISVVQRSEAAVSGRLISGQMES
jgi:hypothetical protein